MDEDQAMYLEEEAELDAIAARIKGHELDAFCESLGDLLNLTCCIWPENGGEALHKLTHKANRFIFPLYQKAKALRDRTNST